MLTMSSAPSRTLRQVKVLSLALNLPGPAALMRLRQLGARCVKVEPPAPPQAPHLRRGDPMHTYAPEAYAELHEGIRVLVLDLKNPAAHKRLHRELASTDILLTSFRPSALDRLGLGWKTLHRQYPALSQVAIVGGPGPNAEIPGHDLTYLAENDLITGLDLPATLYADMSGARMASEAVLQALLQQRSSGRGIRLEVALSDAAAWLAMPRRWGLTQPAGAVGGAHAGYLVYRCRDGRVAVAALEPHFARALCTAAGIEACDMFAAATREALTQWFAQQTRRQLDRIAKQHDLPLHTLP